MHAPTDPRNRAELTQVCRISGRYILFGRPLSVSVCLETLHVADQVIPVQWPRSGKWSTGFIAEICIKECCIGGLLA